MTASEAAKYILAFSDCKGDLVTNKKLQKLLYFAQGLYSAMHPGETLFAEQIEAWDHGPVVPPIYHAYKGYGWEGIDEPLGFDPENFAPEVRELLDAVFRVYGQFNAEKLSQMSHSQPPYINVNKNDVITVNSLVNFFSQVVEKGRSGLNLEGEPIWPSNSFRFQRRQEISDRMNRHRPRLRAIAIKAKEQADPWLDDSDD